MEARESRTGRWVSATRVAERLGVDRRTVARWCAKGDIPATRIGPRGQFRINRDWFEATIRARDEAGEKARDIHAQVQPIRRAR